MRQFEDLPVWQAARDMYLILSAFIKDNGAVFEYSFKDQCLRAGLSVSNNIAEGYERGTNNELSHFLFMAKGSCGELRSMMRIASCKKIKSDESLKHVISACLNISAQLQGWIDYLKRSDLKGQKFNEVREEASEYGSAEPPPYPRFDS
ncbi:MAG: hypothetical protein RL095_1643 [Verrucomicrobiota bacterium]|jgi:four helix bundle protein